MGPGPYPGLGKPGRQLLEFLNKEYWRNSDLFSRRLHGGALLATQKSADHHQVSPFPFAVHLERMKFFFYLRTVSIYISVILFYENFMLE